MRFLPLTRQVELKYANPENVIKAFHGDYFYRVGNNLFYVIHKGVYDKIELSKRSLVLAYQNEPWFLTIKSEDIIFTEPYEIWLKEGQGYNADGWKFVSYQSFKVEEIIASPTPTHTVTPTRTLTPTPSFPAPACTPNLFGGSMYFNGNSYHETQSGSIWNLGSDDFTFEWYMKQTGSAHPTQSIFYFGGPGDSLGHISSRLFGNKLTFILKNRIVASGSLINPTTDWTHIAISHRDNKLHMYQDGLYISSYTLDLNSYATASEHPLQLGGSPRFSSILWYDGFITNFHYVKGLGLYDGTHSYADRVFYPPAVPITPVSQSKVLMLVEYPCDVGFNFIPKINLSKSNHGVVYSTDHPPQPTPTPTITPSITESTTPTPTPTTTDTPTPVPSESPTPTPTITDTPTPTPSA